jgi:hypothetical protein
MRVFEKCPDIPVAVVSSDIPVAVVMSRWWWGVFIDFFGKVCQYYFYEIVVLYYFLGSDLYIWQRQIQLSGFSAYSFGSAFR